MKISLNNNDINKIFLKCLIKRGDIGLEIDSLWGVFRFNLELVKSFEEEIVFLLKQLPEVFFNSCGAFVEDAIIDREGKRWGDRTAVIQLFLLGLIIDKVDIIYEEKILFFKIKNL